VPAQQLFDRLKAVYSEASWQAVQAAWPHHVGDHVGDVIADVRTTIAHETSGWPARIGCRYVRRPLPPGRRAHP
jgi:hypothetical protein